jgi:hypothetical protein
MITAKECLNYARACEQMAQRAAPAERDQLLTLAREWRQMAFEQGRDSNALH